MASPIPITAVFDRTVEKCRPFLPLWLRVRRRLLDYKRRDDQKGRRRPPAAPRRRRYMLALATLATGGLRAAARRSARRGPSAATRGRGRPVASRPHPTRWRPSPRATRHRTWKLRRPRGSSLSSTRPQNRRQSPRRSSSRRRGPRPRGTRPPPITERRRASARALLLIPLRTSLRRASLVAILRRRGPSCRWLRCVSPRRVRE